MHLLNFLKDGFQAAAAPVTTQLELVRDSIKPTKEAKLGDYQANAAMALAKSLGKSPRAVAQQLVAALPCGAALAPPEIAGPGFINLRFRDEWLAERLRELAQDPRLGIAPVARPRRFVIDYSSPNVAKPMHVGHLRSTILGDALTRILRFLGHTVITDNHLGDWGTQFGMLIHGWKHYRDEAALAVDPVQEMVRLYVLVRQKIKEAGGGEDEEEAINPVAEACRQETARLHAGDPENTALWRTMMPWCLAELQRVYSRLGTLPFDHVLGESHFNALLPAVVAALQERGLAEVSDGAVVVFHGKEVDEQGRLKSPPSLIRKRDGAFTYMTTDLATLRFRVEEWKADAVLYVVDQRQALHFEQLFAIGRRWGYAAVDLHHVSFGSVLGEDKKPLRTRDGGVPELSDLLDEAVQRARQVVDENSASLPEAERAAIAEAVGIGAVKYADLCQNRASDYVFSWPKMLAMDGNTAAYMQYAHARNRSIFRKGEVAPETLRSRPPLPSLATPPERGLGLALLRLPEALDAAALDYKPSAITAYLWDLAHAFSGFFQSCPVLKAETEELRQSRLLLCDLTARTIALGLDLLGIRAPERM